MPSIRSTDPRRPRRRTASTPRGLALASLLVTASCADEAAVGPPSLDLVDVSLTEGDDAVHADASLTVTLSRASRVDVTGILQLSSTTATDGVDFEDVDVPFVVPAGTTTLEVALPILGDLRHEPTETIEVTVVDLTDAEVGRGTATITLLDDDLAPTIAVADAEVAEDDPVGALAFVVTLAAASPDTITVAYQTAPGTADEADDYTHAVGVLTFAPGETSQTVSVSVVDDGTYEGGVQTLTLELANPTGHAATLVDALAIGSIVDDEAMPTLTLAGGESVEGTSTETIGSFVVTLSHPSEVAVSATYATSANTATETTDFVPLSGTLTIPAGDTQAVIETSIVSDDIPENPEDFTLTLTDVTGAIGSVTTGTFTITNDDFPTVTVADASGTELDGTSLGSLPFVFHLSQPAPFLVRVGFAVTFGPTSTATTSDIVQISGARGFPPGTTTNTLVLGIRPDALTEPSETFDLVLSSPENAVLGTSVAVGTILDDD